MKIIWSDDNYEIEKKYGQDVRGLRYNNKRPDTILLQLDEIDFNKYDTYDILYSLLECTRFGNSRGKIIIQ